MHLHKSKVTLTKPIFSLKIQVVDKKLRLELLGYLKFAPESALVTAHTVHDAGNVAEVHLEILLVREYSLLAKEKHVVQTALCHKYKYYAIAYKYILLTWPT